MPTSALGQRTELFAHPEPGDDVMCNRGSPLQIVVGSAGDVADGGALLIVAGISLLSIFPAAKLPKYVRGELSAKDIVSEASPEMQGSESAGYRVNSIRPNNSVDE